MYYGIENVEILMEWLKISDELDKLIEDRTTPESGLKLLLKQGFRPEDITKTRLNYLVTLGALRQPRPEYHGRGRGGHRLFQRDIFEVLLFIIDLKQQFTLNEISGIVQQEREDRTKKAFKELKITELIPETSGLFKSAIKETNSLSLFGYDIVKGNVIRLSIIELNNIIENLENDMKAIATFQDETAEIISEKSGKVLSGYISKKKKQKQRLVKKIEQMAKQGKAITA